MSSWASWWKNATRAVGRTFHLGGKHVKRAPVLTTIWATLLLGPIPADVPSYSSREIWLSVDSSTLPNRSKLVRADEKMTLTPVPPDVRQAATEAADYNRLLDVRGPALVLKTGIVLTANPLSVIDASGGCCRKKMYYTLRPADMRARSEPGSMARRRSSRLSSRARADGPRLRGRCERPANGPRSSSRRRHASSEVGGGRLKLVKS